MADVSRTAGVAFFDKTGGEVQGGWCAIGGEDARIFSSASTGLSAQRIWVTNLDWVDYKDISHMGMVKRFDFLRLDLAKIGQEIGVFENASAPEAVRDLSLVVSRVLSVAERACKGIAIGESLANSIYAWLRINDNDNHQRQLLAAFQENTKVKTSRQRGESEDFRLIPSRVGYVESVLQHPVPHGPSHVVKGSMTTDAFMALKHPSFAEISFDSLRAKNSDLVAWGTSYPKPLHLRDWTSQPEMYFMLEDGFRFDIHNVITFEESKLPPQLPEAITNNPMIRSSYSAGLFAHNFLDALMSKRPVRNIAKGAPRFSVSARAVHLRALDRLMSYVMASQLVEAGFRVKRYGYGTITVSADESEVPDLLDTAAGLGFAQVSSTINRFGRDGVMLKGAI